MTIVTNYGFDPWHMTCYPPNGKHISVGRCNNELFFRDMEHSHGVMYPCIKIFPFLIISSNWRWFYVEVLSRESHKKYTKGNGQLLVAGKRLTLGVRGPGEGVLISLRGVRPISPSH